MGRGSSANDLVRWIRTLHEHGAVGGFSDARLVARFVSRDGVDREDAFSALVYRHGPMVQRVCRRMLSDPADADDAFQAVFLVLARKAGSLRRVEDLKSWLYGVAVRTSLEARKRRARLQAREGAPLGDAPAATARDEPFELRALLDEELNKLPNRLREPLLLCELEGISRQEAARRLGLPEGTLSSRLARGRSLLRDRLTRRGVAVGALGAIFPAPAKAAAPADASLRLALKYAARDASAGTVPAAVASLAEGVLLMIQAAKLKTILLATSTLVAACLTAGLVAGLASPPAEAPRKVVAQAVKPPKKDKPSEPLMARGVVVDEAGNPVAGAEVRINAYEPGERSAVTGPDGAFAIPAPDKGLDGRVILVDANDGRERGAFKYGFNLTSAKSREPVRIVVKPSREIAVHVVDSNNAPIEGAAVEAVDYYYAVAHATTGADGAASVRVPANAKVSMIVAQKGGAGLDYAEFGEFDGIRTLRGVPVESLPNSVALTLESARVARIKAVDQDGKPMAGVEFTASGIRKEGRRSELNYFSRERVATTDAEGIATFDWLPPTPTDSSFLVYPVDARFARRPVGVMQGQTAPIAFTLVRNEAIRGRVVMPDGSPAKDVNIEANGTSQGRGAARSRVDGTYEMLVPPNEAYAVHVGDIDWVAAARLDVVVRPGEPVDGIDFQLTKPTFIKGTVTAGDDHHPVAGKYVRLFESGVNAPEDPRKKEDDRPRPIRQARREFAALVDAEGHYKIRVGPGTYKLVGPSRTKNQMITVADQAEIVRDLHILDRPTTPLSGRVIVAADGKPVAGARVDIISWNNDAPPFTVTADAEGRFQADRAIDSTFLCAWSPDGSLGDIVLIGWEEREDTPEVVLKLAPTASATGLLLDEKGEPAANRELEWGRRTLLIDENRSLTLPFSFAKVVTDDQGRFTLPALVVGARYDISVKDDSAPFVIGFVTAQKPGPMDLGTLKIDVLKGR